MKKKNSRESYLSIRQKLIAAVAMLLVATFMVASSSYAWFTLSTAPEVTGIKTSVGANGSLEIALVPNSATKATLTDDLNAIKSGVGDSGHNDTWGNLVDLSSDEYGLKDITLYPSIIVVDDSMAVDPYGAVLATPEYGNDGRITKLIRNGVSGKYDATNKGFKLDSGFGVTALGTTSSITQQQLDWMNAGSKVSTSLTNAKSAAEKSLAENGSGLVNVILQYAAAAEGDAATYEISAIGAMLEDLEVVPGYIEEAMTSYLIAHAANLKADVTDEEFNLIKNAIIAYCEDEAGFPNLGVDSISIGSGTSAITLNTPADLKAVYAKYVAIKNAISTAKTNYATAKATDSDGSDNTTVTISDVNLLKNALKPLMNIDQVTVNGFTKTQISADKNGFVNQVIKDSMVVKIDMPEGSGLFADIAKVSGENVIASFDFVGDINVSGIALNNTQLKINMKTNVQTFDNLILPGRPADRSESADAKLSTLYGYSIDFAFRTNAVASHLMLQTKGVNRIYSSGGSEETLGHGSSMTFNVVDNTFTVDDIKRLMDHVRIVFTDSEGKVVAGAKLNTTDATATGTSITAPIRLCAVTLSDPITLSGSESVRTLVFGDLKSDYNADKGNEAIMELQQNTAAMLSVYVYLDGETIDNSDVAAYKKQSATGTMNLQFSSDANLVPMSYAPLMDQSNAETEDTTNNQTPADSEEPADSTN